MKIPAPLKLGLNFNSLLAAGTFLLPVSVNAIHFPDLLQLQSDYRATSPKVGKPVDLFQKKGGDSNSVHLEWMGSTIQSVRYEQSTEFNPELFDSLVSEFGGGGVWHESPISHADSVIVKTYTGLQQQWHLKGYGGEKGWLGSGIQKGRYYLVFRAFPPFALSKVSEELALQKGVFAELDTSSNWLHIPCKSETKESKAVCFAPGNDTHFRIRVERKIPLSLEIWQEEGESASLSGIRTALESIPDNAQSEYSKDLSHMLFGEAQLFMVKLSQRMPFLFNWPSWQLQDLQIGKVLPSQYLEIIRRAKVPGDSLPALRLEEKGKLRLTINLYFRGTLYLKAEELH